MKEQHKREGVKLIDKEMTEEELEKRYGFKNLNKGNKINYCLDEYVFKKMTTNNVTVMNKIEHYMKHLSEKYDFRNGEFLASAHQSPRNKSVVHPSHSFTFKSKRVKKIKTNKSLQLNHPMTVKHSNQIHNESVISPKSYLGFGNFRYRLKIKA